MLLGILICDTATADPSGKKTLVGIWDRLVAEAFPTKRPVYLYVKLTDAQGHYDFSLRFVRVASGETLAEMKARAEMKDRQLAVDFFVPIVPQFPDPGRYEFQVWANDVYLGAATIDAIQREQQEAP